MQAARDIFLGWTKGELEGRYYYWRQLRDMKVSAAVETMTPLAMTFTADCAGGRWPLPTDARETRWRSPNTSARTTTSTRPSPSSQPGTRTELPGP